VEPEDLIAEGYAARREGRSREAADAFAQAMRLAEQAGRQMMLAQAMTGAGQIARDMGDKESARTLYESAVAILRKGEDPLRLAHTIRHVGDILRAQGRAAESVTHYEEALQIYRSHPATHPLDLANTVAGFARAAGDIGNTEVATSFWQEARSLYASLGVTAGVQEADRRLGCG
jgi:tetratricopeptide (TPR) repeat protein